MRVCVEYIYMYLLLFNDSDSDSDNFWLVDYIRSIVNRERND